MRMFRVSQKAIDDETNTSMLMTVKAAVTGDFSELDKMSAEIVAENPELAKYLDDQYAGMKKMTNEKEAIIAREAQILMYCIMRKAYQEMVLRSN